MNCTRELAWACGTDAANHQMRKAGRLAWNADDYNEAVRVSARLYPVECPDYLGANDPNTTGCPAVASGAPCTMQTNRDQTVRACVHCGGS